MATIEQEQQQRQALQALLDQLNKIQPDSLVRAEDLGKALSFEAGLPVFQRVLGLFRDLSESNLDNVPFETLDQLTRLAQEALTHFKQIQTFTVQAHASNPTGVRDQLINQLRDRWHTYYTTITPIISYSIRKGTDFDLLEREARGSLTLVKQISLDSKTEKDKLLVDMQGALEKVRQAAAEAGVSGQAIHFKNEADSHKKEGRWWFGGTAFFACVAVAYAVFGIGHQIEKITADTPTPKLVQMTVSRVLIVSILFFAVAWCAKNYAASRHNFVTNRHRQNALSTFETFVKGTDDKQTKDAVLVQATKSIFAPQSSGYLKGEPETPQGSQIIEIVRGMTGTKE
jgi:hypothetical protein